MRIEYPVELRWYAYSHPWGAAKQVRGSAVGPLMIPSYEHLLCEDFARFHPDSAEFLTGKLADPDPYLAAYAFKCLIRVKPDLRLDELPGETLGRTEVVNFLPGGCVAHEVPLGEFFRDYFGLAEPEDADS